LVPPATLGFQRARRLSKTQQSAPGSIKSAAWAKQPADVLVDLDIAADYHALAVAARIRSSRS
jgi:hypothetical protein